jgi:hypothetical protein
MSTTALRLVRDEDVAAFKAFRRAHNLPFDERFVPASFENLADLEHRYWKAEEAATSTPSNSGCDQPEFAPKPIPRL